MENEKGIVKLTRKQLYDEIWALSVAGVARKYNLNYGKLIATCKVENIPFPSSGYWTKKNMGKDVSNEIVEFSGLEDTEISLITKDAVVKRIRKAKAEVVEKTGIGEMELCVPTAEDPVGNGVMVKEMPRIKAVCTTHIGPYEKMNEAYAAMDQYIEENNIKVCMPVREVSFFIS